MNKANIKTWLRAIAVGIWIIVLIMFTGQFVGLSAKYGRLIWAAPILPIIPILGIFWLRPKEQIAAWALFTVWLGSTYAPLGGISELSVFAFIIVLALAGYLSSPWLLVLAWFGHIGWDFMPRELPELMHDLPIACMIFDGLIGTYLIWRILSKKQPLTAILRNGNIKNS